MYVLDFICIMSFMIQFLFKKIEFIMLSNYSIQKLIINKKHNDNIHNPQFK
jgi:hypothetical protein